jgi:NAD(P)-dependent dehydrogenase (short-subunit alcohol dehydrogenase family)
MAQTTVMDLSGRTVFVTGASSGIGEHIARRLADAGARLALGARRVDRIEALACEIRSSGRQAMALPVDVTNESSVIAAYDAVEARYGGVDSVIANAGVTKSGTALDIPLEDFDAVFAVNVRGAFLTAREGARRMIKAGSAEREHGRIVFIASITAETVTPGIAAYSASKAAVLKLSRLLAREWARKGINVNAVCPGYIKTELVGDYFETEAGQRDVNRWIRKRMLDIGDLDEIILYLCSNMARHVTGAAFTIDDGQSM